MIVPNAAANQRKDEQKGGYDGADLYGSNCAVVVHRLFKMLSPRAALLTRRWESGHPVYSRRGGGVNGYSIRVNSWLRRLLQCAFHQI